MGPTNRALVNLYRADQQLRAAQGRLESATKNVRVQERRVRDLEEKLKLAQQTLREQQSQSAQMDLDLKSRDGRIERLRTQQQEAKNNKEYQAFLIQINTEKVDRNKVEEQAMKLLESIERDLTVTREMSTQLEGERAKLATMKAQIDDTIQQLQSEIESLQPPRDEAAAATPPTAMKTFERLAERFDGEALSALARLDSRREEYICSSCNMELVADVYNRLETRDDLIVCPSCQRILFIPEDMTRDTAVNKRKEKRPSRARAGDAAPARQSSAIDVLRSVQVEQEEPGETADGGDANSAEPNA